MGRKVKDPQNEKQEIQESCYHWFHSPHTNKTLGRILDKGQRAGRLEEAGEEKRKGKKGILTHTLEASATSACRSWPAHLVDSGCSSCVQTSPVHPDSCCMGGNPLHRHAFAGQANPYSPEKLQPPLLKVSGKAQRTSGSPPPRWSATQPRARLWKEGMCVTPHDKGEGTS